jgi:hypothetical protein
MEIARTADGAFRLAMTQDEAHALIKGLSHAVRELPPSEIDTRIGVGMGKVNELISAVSLARSGARLRSRLERRSSDLANRIAAASDSVRRSVSLTVAEAVMDRLKLSAPPFDRALRLVRSGRCRDEEITMAIYRWIEGTEGEYQAACRLPKDPLAEERRRDLFARLKGASAVFLPSTTVLSTLRRARWGKQSRRLGSMTCARWFCQCLRRTAKHSAGVAREVGA